jgi:prepilin-type N-terminal cleavage/methylation domain-containing protein
MMTGNRLRRCQRGFTLIELLIATAILGLVMAGLLSLLSGGQQAYSRGSNTIDAQQNVRVALELMGKEIREAGYHPRPPNTSPATCPSGANDALVCPAGAGLYPSGGATDAPCWCFYPIINQSATALTLQYDWNGDGTITTAAKVNDAVKCPAGAACRGERVTYALTGQNLTRQEIVVDATPQIVATGITSLTFTYLADPPSGSTADTTTASGDLIRSVRIAITAISGTQGASATMTDQIRLRGR